MPPSAEMVHTVTGVALGAFVALAGIDTSYYHLRKCQLFAHPESRLEHLVHGIRAALMACTLLTFFDPRAADAWWRLGLALVVADLGVQFWDMAIERASRARFQGLATGEYLLHGLATIVHMVAIAGVVAVRLEMVDAKSGAGAALQLHWLCLALAVGTGFTFLQHLYLLLRTRPVAAELGHST